MASHFIPRTAFPALQNLPRSYFLGHHAKGLSKMKTMVSQVDLIIECRDYRVPLTSRNPLFEESLSGKSRVIVYTKKDLGSTGSKDDKKREKIIQDWHAQIPVLFINQSSKRDINHVLNFTKDFTNSKVIPSLTGSRMMIVGMPNVGKSSLLNALRKLSLGKGKAAKTGDQPGVTRSISSSVKIVEGNDNQDAVYLLDTPGVFIPYVPDSEAMLKLALCGSVKDSIIPYTLLADYCLYCLNLNDPKAYEAYHEPTNNVQDLLEAVAKRTGRLQKGGIPDIEAAALWMLQQWRTGKLGKFMLDKITEDALEQRKDEERMRGPSISQAMKMAREARRNAINAAT